MARTFNGTSDQIAFGSGAEVDDLAAYTASALIHVSSNVVSERQVLTKMTSVFQGKMFLYMEGTNKVGSIVGRHDGTSSTFISDANAFISGAWHAIVASWPGGNVAPTCYCCALGSSIVQLSGTAVDGTGPLLQTDETATLRVAARDPLDATFFSGLIAEAAIWNRVLSSGEIAAIGRGFSPAMFPRGRVFYCPIDGRTSPERNFSGSTNGTVTGAAYADHPPVLYPRGPLSIKKKPVASSFKASWARCNHMMGVGQP